MSMFSTMRRTAIIGVGVATASVAAMGAVRPVQAAAAVPAVSTEKVHTPVTAGGAFNPTLCMELLAIAPSVLTAAATSPNGFLIVQGYLFGSVMFPGVLEVCTPF